jgi:hypothetical protein
MPPDGPRLSRKEAIREYKERKIPRGIYAVKCAATPQVWVESSPNLNSARNGLWFALRLGNHPNRTLQGVWNQQGEAAFTWEILEQLEDDIPQLNLADTLKQKKLDWIERLSAAPIF